MDWQACWLCRMPAWCLLSGMLAVSFIRSGLMSLKKTMSWLSDKLLLTRPPIATSRSSVRIRTMLGLREELDPLLPLRWLHKVTQIRRKLNIFGPEERKQAIFSYKLLKQSVSTIRVAPYNSVKWRGRSSVTAKTRARAQPWLNASLFAGHVVYGSPHHLICRRCHWRVPAPHDYSFYFML